MAHPGTCVQWVPPAVACDSSVPAAPAVGHDLPGRNRPVVRISQPRATRIWEDIVKSGSAIGGTRCASSARRRGECAWLPSARIRRMHAVLGSRVIASPPPRVRWPSSASKGLRASPRPLRVTTALGRAREIRRSVVRTMTVWLVADIQNRLFWRVGTGRASECCVPSAGWSPGNPEMSNDVSAEQHLQGFECRDRGQRDQRHFLTGVRRVPRLPAREHAPGGLACRFPGARRHRGAECAQPRAPLARRPQAWDGSAGHGDPARPAGQLAARPGRCARRSDRRGTSTLRFWAWRCALPEQVGGPQAWQWPPR